MTSDDVTATAINVTQEMRATPWTDRLTIPPSTYRPRSISGSSEHPDWLEYVRAIYYVPEGATIPADVTHMNRLTSVDHPDLELRLGLVATRETTAIANVILGLIGRTAADPKDRA